MYGYGWRLAAVAAILLLSIGVSVLVTQEGSRMPLHPEQTSLTGGIHDFSWAPDGKSFAYAGPSGAGFEIFTVPASGGMPRRLTSTQRFKKQPRWSRDGKWIAFIALQDNGNGDLRAVSADGESTLQLTETPADEGDPAWAPDSRQIAYTERVGDAAAVLSVDIQNRAVRRMAEMRASDLQWSPDGKSLAFVANPLQARDERRDNLDLFLVPAEGGAATLLTPGTSRAHDNSPSWAPDSRRIVYASEESGYSNLYILDTGNGSRRVLTTGTMDNLEPHWSPDGKTVAYVRNEHPFFHLDAITLDNSQTRRISDRDGASGGFESGDAEPAGRVEWSPDGRRIAFTHSDPARTSDIWVASIDGGRPVQVTNSMPPELRREGRFVWPDVMSYRSFDGQEIWALVYKPKGAKPRTGHPALLVFRDALDGQQAAAWDPFIQFFVSNGYLVFAPNVRGSSGRGREYRQLVTTHGGDHDIRDAYFGLDRLSSEGLIDTERIGVFGAGTGGFLTAAALVRSESRFRAAVSLYGIVDAVTALSYPETADAIRYLVGSEPLQSPAAYFERSLLNFVDQLRTPLVFFYAAHDPASPFQQLQQFAVQAEVKGKWYDYRVFESESGGWRTWRPANMRLTLEAMDAVFEKYLLGREREIPLSRNR